MVYSKVNPSQQVLCGPAIGMCLSTMSCLSFISKDWNLQAYRSDYSPSENTAGIWCPSSALPNTKQRLIFWGGPLKW